MTLFNIQLFQYNTHNGFMSKNYQPLPLGVTPATKSSTVTFSIPFSLITSAINEWYGLKNQPLKCMQCSETGRTSVFTFAEGFELISPATLDKLGSKQLL